MKKKTVVEYLLEEREKLPKWLESYRPGDPIDMSEVFSSRVAYYPGCGEDGQLVRSLNQAHYAHVYIYADYGKSEEECGEGVMEPDAFKGYHLLDTVNVSEQELTPYGWTPHVFAVSNAMMFMKRVKPYCLLSVFERNETYGDEHGEKRFVLIQLFADGIATYDALFGNNNIRIDAMTIQDHGFGGNYDRFGKGGLMEEIAVKTGAYPKYIFCEKTDNIWDGYELVPGLLPEIGGMWANSRYLYKRKKECV